MVADIVAGTMPTRILGNVSLQIDNNDGLNLKIEGICFSGNYFVYKHVVNPVFSKCIFNQIRTSSYGGYMENPVFNSCIINLFDGASGVSNAMFTNCIILETMIGSNRSLDYVSFELNNYMVDCGISQDVYYNCIVNLHPAYTQYKRMIVNSIIYSNDTAQSTTAIVSNTIGIQDSINYFATPISGNNINLNGFESIFNTFRGTYTDGETFELTQQAASTYLGSDNTQVGVYGGSTPFNPKVTDMRILKVSPAYSSNANGQLPVNVQLRVQ